METLETELAHRGGRLGIGAIASTARLLHEFRFGDDIYELTRFVRLPLRTDERERPKGEWAPSRLRRRVRRKITLCARRPAPEN